VRQSAAASPGSRVHLAGHALPRLLNDGGLAELIGKLLAEAAAVDAVDDARLGDKLDEPAPGTPERGARR